jgi:hypothetical protein
MHIFKKKKKTKHNKAHYTKHKCVDVGRLFQSFDFQPDEGYSNHLTFSIRDEGYYINIPGEGYYINIPDEGYSNHLTFSVPDEGYSYLLTFSLMKVIPIF